MRQRLRYARVVHGRYTAEMVELRRMVAEDARLTRRLTKIDKG